MSTKSVHITADIRIRHVFKCSECKKEQMGDIRSHSFAGSDTSYMDVIINNSTPDPDDRPRGWHCYREGHKLLYCCGCKKNHDDD